MLRAVEGHNLLVYGEAGTGKSRTIAEICSRLQKEKNVQVVCSTGIACEVFSECKELAQKPITIHSWLGVGKCQSPVDALVHNSSKNPQVRDRVRQTDCIIWDECSMGSARLREIFHAITSFIRENQHPFGGIQVIIVGDWLQLKPVSDRFDCGEMMYKSNMYDKLFPHTLRLSLVRRQDKSEERFKETLRELRVGRCSPVVGQLLTSLKRPLTSDASSSYPGSFSGYEVGDAPKNNRVHLFFDNLSAEVFNARCLAELQGDRCTYVAEDRGNLAGIKCPAPSTAHFKAGAPVMCLFNINTNLHNGTRGTFLRKEGAGAVVDIDGAELTIEPVSWSNVNDDGVALGSRTQLPLKLYWASTVHKAQGLQLEAVVVSSNYEFSGGLLYTAISRFRSIKNVQVLDFDPRHVMDGSEEVSALSDLPMATFSADQCSCFEPLEYVAPGDEMVESTRVGMMKNNLCRSK